MNTVIIDYLKHYLCHSWLTGPVFDKELRVSSRKRRNYFLRFAYISLLLTILLFVWLAFIDLRVSGIVNISQMATAGKYMICCIVWFQFCAAQVVAVVMLSNSISDEIYHKTLGMLMTTPITSLQIVLGKLFSKLLQLLLLLAISLPLLAIVRVFGGVPWKYLISSLCITVSTVLFVSSLSLFYSIFCRKAYVVIILTVLTLLGLFALLPFLIISILSIISIYNMPLFNIYSQRIVMFLIFQPNPYVTFFFDSLKMLDPRTASGIFYSAYINCLIMFFVSILLLLLSTIMVRKIAILQVTGQLLSSSREKESVKKAARHSKNKSNSASSIIRITGPPVFWKEMILPFRKRSKKSRLIAVIIFLFLLFYSYWFFAQNNMLEEEGVHAFYSMIFLGLGLLFTIVLSATSITLEKESRSWPLLLTSALDDWEIILGKFCGIISRCMPIWMLYIGHVIIFIFAGVFYTESFILTLILLTYFVIFLCSTGIYFSALFKRTTTAVIVNFAFAIIIWAIIPLIIAIMCEIINDNDAIDKYWFFNPVIQGIVIMVSNETSYSHRYGTSGGLEYSWPGGWESVETTFTMFIYSFCTYMTLALIFLWRAQKRLRRKIF